MDFFGIGNAMKSALSMYRSASRASGRTVMMVESLKPGDRVWFADESQRRHVEIMLKDRGIEGVELFIVSHRPDVATRVFERGTAQGKVIFDHTWVEMYHERRLDEAIEFLDYIERETSHADGEGQAHIDTRKQAIERARWEPWLNR